MKVQELESDIFVIVGDKYQSNAAAFVNGPEIFLVDGLASREDAEQLQDFVERKLGKQAQAQFILCTHYFSDHLAALKLFLGAEIIARKNYMHMDSSRD
ncbi:MAG TPA: hypothetical protein VJ124_18610 [Pyrinomonadaceae bacterium]|nr:hypothetical protein [Pyrinomonadaceae bacterium]